jgi:hypothetical protein
MTYGEPEKRTTTAFSADSHTIWLQFLYDRFKSDRLYDIEHVKVFQLNFISSTPIYLKLLAVQRLR